MAADQGESARRGMSWAELGVIAIVIALFACLFWPTVSSPRIHGLRTTCMNNQHQLGLATQLYETQQNRLPGWAEPMILWEPNGLRPTAMSWVWPLLPGIERGDLYRAGTIPSSDGTFNVNPNAWPRPHGEPHVKILTCPSDTSAQNNGTAISYVVNAGVRDNAPRSTGPGSGALADGPFYRESQASAVFFNRYHDPAVLAALDPPQQLVTQTLAFISAGDGTSNTVMYSENIDATTWTGRDTGGRIAEGDVAFCFAEVRKPQDNLLAINAKPIGGTIAGAHGLPRPSSLHPGGVVVTFCDGHNSFLSQDIDWITWCQLCTPRGAAGKIPSLTAKDEDDLAPSVFLEDTLEERF